MSERNKGLSLLAKVLLIDTCNIVKNRYFKEATEQTYNFDKWFSVLGTGFIIAKLEERKTKQKVLLQIWRINTESKFKHLIDPYSQGARGILISFDPKEEDFGIKIYQLIEDFVSLFYYPIVVGLINVREQNELSINEKRQMLSILDDITVLIQSNWTSEFVFLPYLNDVSSITNFLHEYAEKLHYTLSKIKQLEDLHLNFQIMATTINNLLKIFPEYEGRILLCEKKIIVKGHLSNYEIAFNGEVFIRNKTERKHLCIIEKNKFSAGFRKTMKLLIKQLNISNEFQHLPKEYWNLIMTVITKIIFLLNDDYFGSIDKVFSQQLR